MKTENTFIRSFGSVLRIGAFVLLIALIPYTLFAGYWLYQALSSATAGPAGLLAYLLARLIGCIILTYALWRLLQTGLRLRKDNLPLR
ncbi:MAG: hypothetical protein H7X76_01905 [Prolixibacteraceae bacterium]|nr:hypothetical protein [Burkholderiales bacterium]